MLLGGGGGGTDGSSQAARTYLAAWLPSLLHGSLVVQVGNHQKPCNKDLHGTIEQGTLAIAMLMD